MISVKDLIEGRKNEIPSSLQLFGRISTLTKATDHYQRGSVLLTDVLTGDVIPCQVDRMYQDLQGSLISIPQWTFIILENGLHYLQFPMDNVKRFGSSSTLSDERRLAMQTFLQLLKDSGTFSSSDFSCLHPRQLATTYPVDVPNGVTVAGLLSAKSILYTKQGSEACFFVELKDIYQLHSSTSTSSITAKSYQWTLSVVFKGDTLIKYYMELQVGQHYLFNNLQATTMSTFSPRSQQKQTRRSVLNFLALSSSFLELPKQQCQYLLSNYNPMESDNTSFDVDMPHPAAAAVTPPATAAGNITEIPLIPISALDTGHSNLHHYTGVVTRVIDTLFGVYELDKRILLCLFHYFGYSGNCPYRVGTKLLVTHAHVLSLDSLSTASPVLDMIWNAPKVTQVFGGNENEEEDGFSDGDNYNDTSKRAQKERSRRYILVACMRSDVRIKRWLNADENLGTIIESIDRVDLQEGHIKDFVYSHCIGRHLTFAAMIRQLELFESIKTKFANLLLGGSCGSETTSCSSDTVSPLIRLGEQLIEVVFSKTGNRSAFGQGDLYGDFFQHGQSCLAVNESTNATGNVTLDACPTLRHLISTILNNNNDNNDSTTIEGDAVSYKLDHAPLTEIPPSFVTSHADAARYCYDAKTKDTAWVVGLVEALPDGQVYFMDATDRVKLLVTTADNLQHVPSARWKNTGRLQLGHVYIIKRFHLVVESLTLSGVASSTLEQRYMMCDYQDMKVLGPFASTLHSSPATKITNTTTLSVPLPTKKGDVLRLSHFNIAHGATTGNAAVQSSLLNIEIYCVLDLMPTTMKKDDHDVTGLEKWVRAIRFGLGTMMEPTIVNLVFTSQTGSLPYAGYLQVGYWFGLTLVEAMTRPSTTPGPDNGDGVGRNNQNYQQQQSPETPLFLVDSAKHHFYPIVYEYRHPRFHHQTQQHQHDSNGLPFPYQSPHHHAVPLSPMFTATSRNPSAANWQLWEALAPALHIADAIKMKSHPPEQRQDDNNDVNPMDKTKYKAGNDKNKDKGMISLYGTVLFKGFIADENFSSYFVDEGQTKRQAELFQRLGIGLGQRGLKVFIRLQQVDGLETTDIYFNGDLHHLAYFLGVIPGNKVTLFRVDRRRSANTRKVYFLAGPYTYMEAYPQLGATLFDDLLVLTNRTCVRPRPLEELLPSFSDQNDDNKAAGGGGGGGGDDDTDVDNDIFQAAVFVRRIERIKLQWVCTLCGTEWYQNRCYGNCGDDAQQVFRAEAKVQVSDGTSLVLAMIDGEALVFRLLMLLPSQEETLKQAALTHGALECGFWKNGQEDDDLMASMADAALRNGMTLRDLGIRVKLHGQFIIYGKRYYQRTTKKDAGVQQQRQKMDGLGLQGRMVEDQDPPLKTLMYPLVKVKVESLEPLEPEQQAWNLIDRLLAH